MLRLGSRRRRLIGDVSAIAVSRDGTRLATGTSAVGDSVVVWDVSTWDKSLELDECAGSLDFSPDGSRLYVTYARTTCHDTTTGECLWTRRDVRQPAALSPSGALFAAAAEDQTALIVGPADAFQDARRVPTRREPLSLAFGPADDWLAVAVEKSPVRLLNLRTWGWRELGQASHGHSSLAVSPAGDCIATATRNGRVHLWSVADPSLPVLLDEPTAGWHGARLTFDPFGELLALASEPFGLAVWRVSDRRHLWTKERRYGEGNAAFLRDGKVLVAGVGHAARRFSATDGQELDEEDGHSNEVTSVAAHPEAGIVATASMDHSIGIWQLQTSPGPDETLCVPQRRFDAHAGYVRALALSPDGTVVVSGGADGEIAISDVSTGRVVRRLERAHDGQEVTALAFSRDGSLLASGGDDGALKVWNATTWVERARFKLTLSERERSGFYGGITAVAFAGERLVAALGKDAAHVVRLDGTPVLELTGPWRRPMATSPDGTRMAVGTPSEVMVFELPSGQRLRTVALEATLPIALALSSANLLAIAVFLGSVRVLEHDTGLERFELPRSAGQASTLAFAGSTQLVVGMREGTAVVVDLPPGDPIARARAWRSLPVTLQQRDVGELLAPFGAVATAGYRSAPIAADRDSDGFGVRVRSSGNIVHVRIEPRDEGIGVSVTAMPEQPEAPVEAPPSYVRLAQWIRRRLPGPQRAEADELRAWADELLRTAPPGRVSASAAGPAVTVTFTLATLPPASWLEHVVRETERRLPQPRR